MTELIAKLDKLLTGPNPVAFVRITPDDWAELRLVIEDAERYRWLREQHWNDSVLCVVSNPKKNVKLGTDCPSEQRLDDAIDAARHG